MQILVEVYTDMQKFNIWTYWIEFTHKTPLCVLVFTEINYNMCSCNSQSVWKL